MLHVICMFTNHCTASTYFCTENDWLACLKTWKQILQIPMELSKCFWTLAWVSEVKEKANRQTLCLLSAPQGQENYFALYFNHGTRNVLRTRRHPVCVCMYYSGEKGLWEVNARGAIKGERC